MRTHIVILLSFSMVLGGCRARKRISHDPTTPVVTAGSVHKQSATERAQAYDDLADAVRDGKVKTINDCVDFFNPRMQKVNDEYTSRINELRNTRLKGADDTLPSDAEKVFRQFAAEYRRASK